MKYLKKFESISELDIDSVLSKMKSEHGWGDLHNYIEDFESSDYYTGTMNSDAYLDEFHHYMTDRQLGRINDESDESDEN